MKDKPFSSSIGTEIDDLGWPRAAISRNFAWFHRFVGNNG